MAQEREKLDEVRVAFDEALVEFQRSVGSGDPRAAKFLIRNQLLAAVAKKIAALSDLPSNYYGVVDLFTAFAQRLYADAATPADLAHDAVAKVERKLRSNRLAGFRAFCGKQRIDLRNIIDNVAAAAPARTAAESAVEVLAKRRAQTAEGAKPHGAGKLTRREQDYLVVAALTEWVALERPTTPLHELFDRLRELGAVREQQWSLPTQRKLARIVHRCIALLPASCKVAVDDESLHNILAVKTNPDLETPPVSSAAYDAAFLLDIHLLRRHFHEKTAGASAAAYPGHNICVVALNEAGDVVGMDFNQCKSDKNLCSHAEKRLAEALVNALKATTPEGKPPSLEGFTFISSLEPCHMCANFISRMGVSKIGYLMADPMQLSAMTIAANMLKLTVIRPQADWGAQLEAAFKTSGFPEEEITSWLGAPQFLGCLERLCAQYPLSDAMRAFFDATADLYPGCVRVGGGALGSTESNADAAAAGLIRASSELFAAVGEDSGDDEDDVC